MAGSRVLLFGSAPPLVPAAAALDARTINLVLVEEEEERERERERESTLMPKRLQRQKPPCKPQRRTSRRRSAR